ncbi:MAG: ATP-dependent RecD-like DNA helicase [Acidobacteriota bacterium]
MNEALSHLEGTLERVVYSNPENAWSVVRLVGEDGEESTAVGNLLGVQPGESLRLEGRWIEDPKFGRQFKVSSYLTLTPNTLTGLRKYLGSGLIPGIGKVMAKRLVDHFGLDTLDVIENHPERLGEVSGIGTTRRLKIRESWIEQRDIKDLMIFLQSHEVATHHAVKIYKAYGKDAMGIVRQDPYRLSAEVWGIGFRSADRIASALGLPADSPQRARAGLLHLLSEAADKGHVYRPQGQLLDAGIELLAIDEARLAEALEALRQAGEVVVEERRDGELAVFLKILHFAESGLAERLRAVLEAEAGGPEIDVDRALDWFAAGEAIDLAPQQREAIRRGLTRKVLVITGGPGTGKTTLIRGIVRILAAKKRRILLAAPTGRAAKRLAEATGREARTIHRLLEFNPQSMSFDRGPENPLSTDLLIVDEASMLDTHLAYSLIKALPERARLVLVGDVDQLPSVGPGKVLADCIASGAVDVVRLTEIFRQAERSLIVVNAHRVNAGDMPILETPRPDADGRLADFFFIERSDPQELINTLAHLVAQRIPKSFGFDPVEEVQVLTPMNRGPLGTENLNNALRQRLNPQGDEVSRAGRVFRVGDKVMQIRNNYDLDVFNGDLGRVQAIDEENRKVAITFDGRPVAHDFASLDELAPAYACSIHKSQGSEYPCVVLPISNQHYIMLQRNLLYTALTRAKKLAVLVGETRALGVAVRNGNLQDRFTRLAERLASRPS